MIVGEKHYIINQMKMINSRHTGMIIWIIKILRRLHDTFYKQNALSLAFRQRVGVRNQQG